jgi:pyrimidine deaminase RibD-like protein
MNPVMMALALLLAIAMVGAVTPIVVAGAVVVSTDVRELIVGKGWARLRRIDSSPS